MSSIIVDIDGTLDLGGGRPNERLVAVLNEEAKSGQSVIVVSARPDSRLEETRKMLEGFGLDFSEIHLSDFPQGPNSGVAYKKYKVEKLIEEGKDPEEAVDNDSEVRRIYDALGLDTYSPAEYIAAHILPEEDNGNRAIDPNGYETTKEIRDEAERGLAWRRAFGRGGTEIGVARARDLSSGKMIPYETIVRMSSYFARHEVDMEAMGWNRGEDGYPSAGRIAWALWGGDVARAWAEGIISKAAEDSAARSVEDTMGIEFRTAKVELRAVDENGMTFEGYAALFDSPSADGVSPEIVKDTAFRRSLSAVDRGEWDVRAYQDHNPQLLLGTTKSNTLELVQDAKGLLARIRLNPDISFHRDLAAIVKTMGTSLGMSFGFWNTAANRVNDNGVRELRDVKLVEVSALTGLAPYYPGTVSLVSVRGLADKVGVDSSDLRDAVAALLAGEATKDHAAILAAAMSASARDVEGVPTVFPNDAPVEEPVQAPAEEVVQAPVEEPEPRPVPRTVREKHLELIRREVK